MRRVRLTALGRTIAIAAAIGGAVAWIADQRAALLASTIAFAAPWISWLTLRRALRGITVAIEAPAEVFARERFVLCVRVTKAPDSRTDFGITIDVPGPRLSGVRFVRAIGPGESVEGRFRAAFRRRGLAKLAGIELRTAFPLGLVEVTLGLPADAEVLVLPEPARLSASRIRALAAITPEPASAEIVRHRTRDPEDLYMLAPWQPGIPARRIHARSSARHGRPIARLLRGSPEGAVVIALDTAPPQDGATRSGAPAKFERAVALCAALVLRFERDGVRHRLCAGDRTPAVGRVALRSLATIAPSPDGTPSLAGERGTLVWLSPAGRPAPRHERFDAVVDFLAMAVDGAAVRIR